MQGSGGAAWDTGGQHGTQGGQHGTQGGAYLELCSSTLGCCMLRFQRLLLSYEPCFGELPLLLAGSQFLCSFHAEGFLLHQLVHNLCSFLRCMLHCNSILGLSFGQSWAPLLGMCITHPCDYTRICEAKHSSSPVPTRLLRFLHTQLQPCLEQLTCCSLRGICASLDAAVIYRDMESGLGWNQGWIRVGLGLELHLSIPQTFRR